jgi:hypothetical protein
MRALSGTDVAPQVLAMGIGRSAASQVSGECWKWKARRRVRSRSPVFDRRPIMARKVAWIAQGLLEEGAVHRPP